MRSRRRSLAYAMVVVSAVATFGLFLRLEIPLRYKEIHRYRYEVTETTVDRTNTYKNKDKKINVEKQDKRRDDNGNDRNPLKHEPVKDVSNNGNDLPKRKNDEYVFYAPKQTELSKRCLDIGPNGTRVLLQNSKIQPILTLFTTWDDSAVQRVVHENTVCNWMSLLPLVRPVVLTNDTRLRGLCHRKGWSLLYVRNISQVQGLKGKPLLKYMFLDVVKHFNTRLVGFANSDILFTSGLPETIQRLYKIMPKVLLERVLIAGARTNVLGVRYSEAIDWTLLENTALDKGTQFPELYVADYVIASRDFPWQDMPDIMVGVPGVDSFLIWYARILNITTVDVTNTVLAVHQTTSEGNFVSRNIKLPGLNKYRIKQTFPHFWHSFGFVQCMDYHSVRSGNDKEEFRIVRQHARPATCDYRILYINNSLVPTRLENFRGKMERIK